MFWCITICWKTIENRVREVLEEKLAVIFEQMGIDKMEDVLDSQMADMDFTDVYIKAIAEPKNSDYYIEKLEDTNKTTR